MLTEEQQKAKNELLTLKRIDDAIKRSRKELRHLRQDRLRLSASDLSGMPRGSKQSQDPAYVNAIMRIDEVERSIKSDISHLSEDRAKLVRKINRLPEQFADVLYHRYVDGYSVERIAAEMHYSTRSIIDKHKRALTAYANLHVTFTSSVL